MNKIPTLFVRDEENRSLVLDEVNPVAQWVIDGEGQATRKYDGTCLLNASVSGWWARREVKPGKSEPAGFVAVEFDTNTGKTVGWEPIVHSSFVKFWQEAIDRTPPEYVWKQGTYELLGPKINGNPEGLEGHTLYPHADAMPLDAPRTYGELAKWLKDIPYEGIVWHHEDGRMAKLKRRDFGYR